MRIDMFFKIACIFKSRAIAANLIKKELIKVNNKSIKAAYEVKPGDMIEINDTDKRTELRILAIPQKKSVSKKEAKDYYDVISSKKIDSF